MFATQISTHKMTLVLVMQRAASCWQMPGCWKSEQLPLLHCTMFATQISSHKNDTCADDAACAAQVNLPRNGYIVDGITDKPTGKPTHAHGYAEASRRMRMCINTQRQADTCAWIRRGKRTHAHAHGYAEASGRMRMHMDG
eukprot:365642-Chlamydomonas_euryale.AAC.8